jgi:hypothetical protein
MLREDSMSTLALLVVIVLGVGCAGTWTELGPNGAGRVSAIVALDANQVWVATPGGGIWKSRDGGATFTWAGNSGLGDFTAVHLALDRTDSSRMYLRTWSGFLVSTDGGAQWRRTLSPLPQGDPPYLYPSSRYCSWSPTCPPTASPAEEPGPYAQLVFSATQSVILTSLPCQGLQYSLDRGEHFTQLWLFDGAPRERNPANCLNAITVDEVTRRVWVATREGFGPRIYRSVQPWSASGPPVGLTWELVSSGLPSGSALALAWGGTADRVMALVQIETPREAYLFDGRSWVRKPWNSDQCDFRDGRPLIWAGGNDFFAGGVTWAYTNDAGDHWTCPPLDNQYVDIRAIHANPSANRLWIGGDQNALGGSRLLTRYTWSPGTAPAAPVRMPATGIKSWQAYTIAQGHGTNRILVGAQDIGSACSDDLGLFRFALRRTEEAAAIAWPRAGGGNTVYVYSTKGTLERSINASSARNCSGVTFTYVSAPDRFRGGQAFTGPHTLAVHPSDAQNVFLITGGQVVYSRTGGTDWQRSPLPLTTASGATVGLTAIMVDERGVVYVGTQDHGVYTCSDTALYCDGSPGALAWTPFALNPGGTIAPPAVITAITQSNPPPAPRTFWISTSQGVYRRRAGDTDWVAVNTTRPYPVSDVVVDPTCRTRVYTAFGYLANKARTPGGIDVSSDNGATWRSLTAGHALHNSPVTQVLVDAAEPRRVFASTFGRGAWLWVWPSLPSCAP